MYAVIKILNLNDSSNNEELVCMQNKDTPILLLHIFTELS